MVSCRLIAVLLLGLVMGGTVVRAFAGEEPFRRGKVVRRTTRAGTTYAVYLPSRWRKRSATPLFLQIPLARSIPGEAMENESIREIFDRWNADRGGVVVCSVLCEAHNRVNPRQSGQLDRERFLRLLDRDAAAVASVLDELATELDLQKDAMAIYGGDHTCEVALGVAVRLPGRFTHVMIPDVSTIVLSYPSGPWRILPVEAPEAVGRTSVLLSYSPDPNGLAARAERHRQVQRVLLDYGFPRVEVLDQSDVRSNSSTYLPPIYVRFLEQVEEARARAEHEAERDRLLEDGRRQLERRKLDRAVAAYRKARQTEQRYELSDASAELYRALVATGRQRLTAAGLAAKERRTACRKLLRIFAGLPFAEEVRAAMEQDG